MAVSLEHIREHIETTLKEEGKVKAIAEVQKHVPSCSIVAAKGFIDKVIREGNLDLSRLSMHPLSFRPKHGWQIAFYILSALFLIMAFDYNITNYFESDVSTQGRLASLIFPAVFFIMGVISSNDPRIVGYVIDDLEQQPGE